MTSSSDVASSPDVAPSSLPVVALVVLGSDPEQVAAAVPAAAAEGVSAAYVVGGGAATQRAAEAHGASWLSRLPDLGDELAADVTHIWLVHADCRPRPGALAALTAEAARTDASVAGSKVLRASDPAMLESVGGATDVFGHPYSGLSEGEVDQEQYDVVRDVAFIPVVSVLIRRDLFKGLSGPDLLLAPLSQGVDLAQRARLLGGRVVVVPSSEVLHHASCAAGIPPWRERAGELRAMAKAYGPLTAAWAIPFSLVIGLVTSLAMLLIGQTSPLTGELKAWLWNVKNLPSTWRQRRSAAQARRVGDEELFRYQASGSVMLRQAGQELSDWFRVRRESGAVLGAFIEQRRGFWQEPAFVASAVAVVFAAVATRSLWMDGMPVTGYSLPASERLGAVLTNYAGGWNPSGLGWTEPMRPAIPVLSIASALGLGPAALTFGALMAAFVGTLRLLRVWRVPDHARIVGAFVAAFGPAMLGIGATGYWPALLAAGLLPWAVATTESPWTGSWRRRVGAVGSGVLVTGIMASLVPWLALAPFVIVVLARLAGVGGSGRSVVRAGVLGAGATIWLVPWLAWVAPSRLLTSGGGIWWDVPVWLGLGLAGAVLAAVAVADRPAVPVLALGGILALGATAVTRSSVLGAGVELSAAMLVVAGLGVAVAAGGVAAVIQPGRLRRLAGFALLLAVVGLMSAGSALPLLAGRAGLGGDVYGSGLAFTEPRSGPQGPDRILFLGAGAPGESRMLIGVPYRVMSAGTPLHEAWLPVRQSGDVALEETLLALRDSQMQRPGRALAEFGIRWVIATEPNALDTGFQAKLDMRRLPLFDVPFTVYENLESSPRAVRDDGVIWRHDGFGYGGVASSEATVRIAEQHVAAWGPSATADEWAAVVSAEQGTTTFDIDPTRRTVALGAAAFAGLALLGALVGLGAKPS